MEGGSYFFDNSLLPYDFENCMKTNEFMYISGSYYVIKKSVALKHPLDENLVHCGGEDLEYSRRLHCNGIFIKCNSFSTVHFLKDKEQCIWEKEIDAEYLNRYIQFCNNT